MFTRELSTLLDAGMPWLRGLRILEKQERNPALRRAIRQLAEAIGSGETFSEGLVLCPKTFSPLYVSMAKAGEAVGRVHQSVKEGETITVPLRASGVFPAMVVGIVDIGDQTGVLPDMLMKIADNYDDEVDNAVSVMASLLEPIMIVFLAVMVGGIVIAMFLPILEIINGGIGGPGGMDDAN